MRVCDACGTSEESGAIASYDLHFGGGPARGPETADLCAACAGRLCAAVRAAVAGVLGGAARRGELSAQGGEPGAQRGESADAGVPAPPAEADAGDAG